MASFVQRMIGAARLSPATYEEVEADKSALGQAMLVVALSAAAAGVGEIGDKGLLRPIASAFGALIGWYIWAVLTWFIGTKLLPESTTQADIGQLLRTTGFSAGPGIIRIFAFLPMLGGFIRIVAGVWMLSSMVVAVRQALDYQATWRAVLVCVIGFAVNVAIGVAIAVAVGASVFSLGN